MADADDLALRLEYVKRWARGGKAPPLYLTLGTTYVCNLRCRFCAQRCGGHEEDAKKLAEELSEEQLVRMVKDAAELGVRTVGISGGGEPFMSRKTLAVMRAIKAHGLSGMTTTNGMLISEGAVRELVEIGWDRINFSVDGPDAETHDSLRDSAGCFDRTVRTLRLFKKWKSELKRESPRIAIHTVLVNKNHDKIHKMVQLTHEVGAKNFDLFPVTVHSQEGEVLRLRPEHWGAFQESVALAQTLAKKYGLSTNVGDFGDPRFVIDSNNMINNFLIGEKPDQDPDREAGLVKPSSIVLKTLFSSGDYSKIPCYEPWITLVIHPEGYLDPCEMATKVSHVGKRSLKDIWYNDGHLNKMRREFLERRLPESCAKCCGPKVSMNVEMRNCLMTEGKHEAK